MYQVIQFSIEGVAPLLLHNARLADPLDPIVKGMKEITRKKTRTDADLEALAQLEFTGSFYLNESGAPIIRSDMLERCVVEGAKKSKLGKQALAGMYIADDADLIYDGPKTVDGLYEDKRFVDRRYVIVNRGKVIRTRPIFMNWAAKFQVSYLPQVLNRADIVRAVEQAGQLVGVGDYRPRFGRFDVSEAKDLKVEMKKAS